MNKKKLSENKRNYDVARHHAWAGSVILAAIVATRGFLELAKIEVNDYDYIFVFIGLCFIIYTLFSVFLTYHYRSGLTAEEKKVVEIHHHEQSDDLEKERLKIEKKKAKAETKKTKKLKK